MTGTRWNPMEGWTSLSVCTSYVKGTKLSVQCMYEVRSRHIQHGSRGNMYEVHTWGNDMAEP